MGTLTTAQIGKIGHEMEDLVLHEMPGSTKTEREIYEH
ncbi:MAG: hypothetical protein RI955_536, partial [Bacteroidota bacterium]